MSKRVLIVESGKSKSCTPIEAAAGGLTRRGFDVKSVQGAKSAFERLDADPSISLVLLCIEAGGGRDGAETARLILSRREVPLIFLVDSGDPDFESELKGIPAYGCLPVDTGEKMLAAATEMALSLSEKRSEEGLEEVHFLAETAFEFIDPRAGRIGEDKRRIYTYIAEKLRRLNPKAIVIVNSIHKEKQLLRNEALVGVGSGMKKIIEHLGFDPLGSSYPIDESLANLESGRIDEFHEGIHGLSFGKIPKAVAKGVERLLNIGRIYGIGFIIDGEIYANAVMLFSRGEDIRHRETVQAFTRQASIALKRGKIEDALFNSRRQLQLFIDSSPDFFFLKDTKLRYLLCNNANAAFFGRDVTEIIGKTDYDLMDRRAAAECEKSDRQAIEEKAWVLYTEHAGGRVFETRKFPVLQDGEVTGIAGIIRDVSELREKERKLTRALKEKDFLMRELNHRVKNNLYIITSLIRLKMKELEDEVDLSDIIHQIDAIGLVHEKLYRSDDIGHISMREYVEALLDSLFGSLAAGRVRLEINIEDIVLSSDVAVPLGLIINEIATNALKHGFNDEAEAVFGFDFKADAAAQRYLLRLSNSGRPFPEETDVQRPQTLGLWLITSLVKQLDGKLELQRSPQPTFHLQIPMSGESGQD
jgi:PAS domain S-box-containing protein